MDTEFKCGSIIPDTKEIGELIKLTAKESSIMQMVMSMREIGETIRLMERESTHMQMELYMMVTGSTIDSMGMVLRVGQTVQGMRDNMLMVRKKAKELFTLPTDLSSKVISKVMRSTGLEHTNGPTERNMMGSGSTTKCAVRAP